MAEKSRPGGIIFVSVLNFLFALWMILGTIIVIMLVIKFSNIPSWSLGKELYFVIILGLNSILFIAGGIGLLLGKKWGKAISIIAYIILTISSMYNMMSFEFIDILLIIVSLLIIVYLLINKKVRDYISN